MNRTVLEGPLVLAMPLAMLAGLVSFLSPCVLPLVPGYLGYVTGLTGVDPADQRRPRLVVGGVLFVAGFTAVYVTMGWVAGWSGQALQAHQRGLQQLLGVVTVLLGLVFWGILPAGGNAAPRWRPAAGLAGAPALGAVFALGWTACTGPTLAAILALSGGIGPSPGRGAALATAYCLGLGLPFIAAAAAYQRALRVFGGIRRHQRTITRCGAVLLIGIGVLLCTGLWAELVARLQGAISGFGTGI